MRDPELQAKLDAMTTEEKYEATSYRAFFMRSNVIAECPPLYLTRNEYPRCKYNYEVVVDHLTLWGADSIDGIYHIGHKLIAEYHKRGYYVAGNPPKAMSVPGRPHIHFILTE